MSISNIDNNNVQNQQIYAKATSTQYPTRITIMKLVVGQGVRMYFDSLSPLCTNMYKKQLY